MSDIIYLESDEEITSAIDKMRKASGDTVKIVLPKRAALLQSIVNQKLLKKAADDQKKNLVLVTTDRTAAHLAGKVGLAVAASLKAQARVPDVEPQQTNEEDTEIEEQDSEDAPEETLPEADAQISDLPDAVTPSMAAQIKTGKKPAFAKPMMVRTSVPVDEAPVKKLAKVPDFNGLQKRMLWGGGVLAAILALVAVQFFFKTAKVTLFAKGTLVKADFDFAVDPALKETDAKKAVMAGQKMELSRELTTQFTATGKKDVGTKANGQMNLKNETGAAQTLVAGTRLRAPDGKIFLTDSEVTVPAGGLDGLGNIVAGQASVAVTAENAGDNYNLAPARYTIPALAPEKQSKIYGQGNQMTGGTTREVTVVTQEDIDKAKDELIAQEKAQSQKALESKAATNYIPLAESFFQNVTATTSSPALDAEATQATLTVKITYTELAVNRGDYEVVVREQIQAKIGAANQIYDDGISSAQISPGKREVSGRQEFHFSSDAYAGAKLITKDIAKELVGKRYGDAIEIASKQSGVERVEVSLWPSWSSKLPRFAKNIQVEIKVAGKEER
jgi:hypothetical protein